MAYRILELQRLLRNRHLPPAELRKLQEGKLRAVIGHAYENVPYYRTLFRSAGLRPQDVHTLEDLQRVPITSKEALRAAGVEGALARGVDPSTCEVNRSTGSTGKPFASYHSHQEATTEAMVGFRALHTAGVRPLGSPGGAAASVAAARLDEPPGAVSELPYLPHPSGGGTARATQECRTHRAQARPQQVRGLFYISSTTGSARLSVQGY